MLVANAAEQRRAVAEHHRMHGESQLVDQPRVEQAGHRGGTARHIDLAAGLLAQSSHGVEIGDGSRY
jgi:hypothetical protein